MGGPRRARGAGRAGCLCPFTRGRGAPGAASAVLLRPRAAPRRLLLTLVTVLPPCQVRVPTGPDHRKVAETGAGGGEPGAGSSRERGAGSSRERGAGRQRRGPRACVSGVAPSRLPWGDGAHPSCAGATHPTSFASLRAVRIWQQGEEDSPVRGAAPPAQPPGARALGGRGVPLTPRVP